MSTVEIKFESDDDDDSNDDKVYLPDSLRSPKRDWFFTLYFNYFNTSHIA